MPKRKARHNLQLRRKIVFFFVERLGARVILSTMLGLCIHPNLSATETETEEYVDWVPREQLSPEERAQLLPFCRGAFREPEATHEDAGMDPNQAPIRIEADRSSVTNNSHIVLEGQVEITQGSRRLQADRMSYDRDTERASLTGQVIIRQPGTLIRGDEAHVHMDGEQGRFVDARFLLHDQHLRGGAGEIEQTADGTIILTDGRVTSCEPVEESWVLEGGKLILDPVKRQGSGRHVVLRFVGMPIFYLPYIRFPLGDERQSGFLFPVASYSGSSGLDFATPYYFNLAPNYDLTLTPRVITERGAMLEAEGRHLSPLFETRMGLAYLANDRGGNQAHYRELISSGVATEAELQPYLGEDRWLAHIGQSGGRDQRWYSRVDYNAVSDLDYFRDLDTASFAVTNTTYLNRSAEVGYIFPHWSMQARLQDYQTLLRDLDESYRQVPRIDANGRYNWGDWHLQLNNEYVNFDHTDDFRANGSPVITGGRARAGYQLNWDKQWQWGFLRPHLGVQHLNYQLDEEPLTADDHATPNLTTPEAALDLGLIFDRNDPATGMLRQTLEPRLFYLYRDHVDHSELFGLTARNQAINFDTTALNFSYSQLFRETRFSGGDRIDDANQLAAGLTTRWYGGSRNRELLSASLGQIRYFEDRQVTLSGRPETFSRSEIATQLNAAITEHIDVRADLLVDDRNADISRGSLFAHFGSQSHLLNVGYRFIGAESLGATSDNDVKQLDVSFSTALNSQWQLVGRTNYDITDNRELEAFFGFEHNDCCYRVRILARRWLDSKIADLVQDNDLEYREGIFFEIQFKGLGGTGDRVSSILADSIPGYRERQPHLNH